MERELELVKDGAMTIEEAIRFAGVGRSFLYEAMARGELAYVKIGAARRIPRRRWRSGWRDTCGRSPGPDGKGA